MKFWFHTFGCRVNQYETQALRERMLADPSVESSPDWESADVCVVNSCTVTAEADKDALRLVRRISRRNPRARLVVTGCLADRDRRVLAEAAPDALVVGNGDKESIAALLGLGSGPAAGHVSGLAGRSRALVKVQDGCDGACSYCVVPGVRRVFSSKPLAELEAEVSGLVRAGHAEITLCGIRLGRYSSADRSGRVVDLAAALESLVRLPAPGEFRLRLSSLEIAELSDRLIEALAGSSGQVCPSFHLPLQSGSDAVLRRMNRPYDTAFFSGRLAALRRRLPGAAVFTDVMAGFPGETEAEFRESLAFVKAAGLRGLHVFRYSRRPGTSAAAMPGQVPADTALRRARLLRDLDADLRARFAAEAVGTVKRVVAVKDGVRARIRKGCQALSEDFLTVALDRDPGPGLHQARVTSAQGPTAYGHCERLKNTIKSVFP
ncbi:MAG: MiaB/RimO family radical SAM methylthiotransferase [Elusimicrobia bacterium]|nr:MiaB/RimO family radical SAM methylthiotransferase [Elusimicrobiota bacterium]